MSPITSSEKVEEVEDDENADTNKIDSFETTNMERNRIVLLPKKVSYQYLTLSYVNHI